MQIGRARAPISRVSQAYPDRVEVRGRDLCGDLMGRLSFTEYFHLLLTGREPTAEQRYFLDLLLVAIAEHGMMPTNVAARMTLAADPGSLQGAVAAGILGAGPVILGTLRHARDVEGGPEKVEGARARGCGEGVRGRVRLRRRARLRPPVHRPTRPPRRAHPRARGRARGGAPLLIGTPERSGRGLGKRLR